MIKKYLAKDENIIATAYNNIASTYRYLGNYKKALAYNLKDMVICEKVLDENHLDLAISYSNIAGTYSKLGDYEKALEYHLKDKQGITFIGGDTMMKVVNLCGYNWLLIHGHQQGFSTNISQTISKLVRLYADKGIIIRQTILGHIHETLIADFYARSSSLVGANSYSENGLLLTSRASQNSYIQYDNGNIDALKIDLQNFDGYIGYPIQKELEEYNAKSASKLHEDETIIKVVI